MHSRIAPDVGDCACYPQFLQDYASKSYPTIYLLNFSFSASSIKAVLTLYICTYKLYLVMSPGRCWFGREWLRACLSWRKWTSKAPKPERLITQKAWGEKKLLTGRYLPTHINFRLVDKEQPLCQSDCQAQIYGEWWVANSAELSWKTLNDSVFYPHLWS